MKLTKTYDPSEYENDIYSLWEKSQAFTPQKKGESYSIVAPPPNANADLHIGYGLTLALEDIAVRYHRLKGEKTLFVPGADHAGFETWVVYERKLAQEGKSRFDFSRQELYNQVWDFVAQNRSNFETQIRRLGASVDWQHFTFTLDPKIVRQAYRTFKQMWDEGLIYRGERLVNFCTFHGTSFADIEVEYKEEQGKLWHIRYPLTDGSGSIEIATTRPETMLGDTGVAINPSDPRYRNLVGKTVTLPITGREIPIVADDFVDMEFGTGAVKLTPAHDLHDYEAAKRHNLPMISVINHEGKMADNVPEAYRHLKISEAREKIVKDLEEKGHLLKTDNLKHSVGHCYKCGTVIEPLLREQWFVDMQPLAQKAIKVLEANEITFYPETKKEQLVRYLKNLKDWNISRQIAWGIPIPAFQNIEEPDDWIYDERVDEEIITLDGKTYRRDPDVFDTWFSSSSWPYATLDFPESEDFKDFYPLSLMETGGEILYPWVSRMLMLGLYVTGKIPFEKVYIHGYVMAEDGSKISKSKGNAPNMMEALDTYGSDAMRMGIIVGRAPAVNRGYDIRRIEEARNFCNKVWNIARFIEDKVDQDFKQTQHWEPQTLADHWILNKFQHTVELVTNNLDSYRFSEAYELIYHFVWDDLADWYLEASKTQTNLNVLTKVLESTLVLLHPFAPFLTETIWQTLNWHPDSLLINGEWPIVPAGNKELAGQFEELKDIISEVRNLRVSLKLKETKLHYIAPEFIHENAGFIEKMTGIKVITEVQLSPGLRLINTPYQCWLDVENKILENYKQDLGSRKNDQEKVVEGLKKRLANPDYMSKAPAEIREQSKQQLVEAEQLLATIEQETKRFDPHATVTPVRPQATPQAQPAPAQEKPTAPPQPQAAQPPQAEPPKQK